MLYPLIFRPIFKERIWGGRALQTLYGKNLPPDARIGESWEISDRPGDESVVANGAFQGRTLGDIFRHDPQAMLGKRKAATARFPLLVKIIDAQEILSLQVHPPAGMARELGGEPKTEMWYVAQASPGAELFAGLKKGVSRSDFERNLASQTVAECFHRIPARAGDAMFLPSGRVHALGKGMVIFEVQENSDTTFRVFDWNRVDASGKPRELHVKQSLDSIDFTDFEPALLPSQFQHGQPGRIRPLVNDELFEVSARQLSRGDALSLEAGRLKIIGVIEGSAQVISAAGTVGLKGGQFCLVPAVCEGVTVEASDAVTFLEVRR